MFNLIKSIKMNFWKPVKNLLIYTLLILIIMITSSKVAGTDNDPTDWVAIQLRSYSFSELNRAKIKFHKMIEYENFTLLLVSPEQVTDLREGGIDFQAIDKPYHLTLGGITFDPAIAFPNATMSLTEVFSPDTPGFHLVQFWGPTKDTWLQQLTDRGLKIVQYVYPYTYITWGTENSKQQVASLETVRWAGTFLPSFKSIEVERNAIGGKILVQIMLYKGAETNLLIEQIEELGGNLINRSEMDEFFEVAVFDIETTAIDLVSNLPGVYTIQSINTDGGDRGEIGNQVNAGNTLGNYALPGYINWLNNLGLSGGGVIIANVDSGIDHDHPDLINRIMPCIGSTCGGSLQSNHGTHTAGIMAGDGSSGVTNGKAFLRGLGMAPGANLIEQVYSPTYTYANGMLTLIQQSFQNGAVLSGNSWGPSGSPQGYDINTRQVDIGVRDAAPLIPGNQQFSYILSIMNGYGGTSTQGTPDEAKNIFSVGSTVLQTAPTSQLSNINDISGNSAHGPALDGRLLPHIVAPGCSVDSSIINGYSVMCGTSMASPQVSGSVALFIEKYRHDFGVDPSPSLIKAAFLPVAHDLAGYKDADGNLLGHPFDAKQGWGRLNTNSVLAPQGEVLYYDNPLVLNESGEIWQISLNISDPSKPLRVMLAWTDAPGHGLGGSTPAWNNDLDLSIKINENIYVGNYFDLQSGLSIPCTINENWYIPCENYEFKNNTEGIFLPAGVGEIVTITVTAANINSDGVPGNEDLTDQDFSLVVYNISHPFEKHDIIFPLVINQ